MHSVKNQLQFNITDESTGIKLTKFLQGKNIKHLALDGQISCSQSHIALPFDHVSTKMVTQGLSLIRTELRISVANHACLSRYLKDSESISEDLKFKLESPCYLVVDAKNITPNHVTALIDILSIHLSPAHFKILAPMVEYMKRIKVPSELTLFATCFKAMIMVCHRQPLETLSIEERKALNISEGSSYLFPLPTPMKMLQEIEKTLIEVTQKKDIVSKKATV